jgi:putative phage-type endonuclease
MTDLLPAAPAIVQTEREQWLARRRELVTASDAAAILGADPRRGPLAVYAVKVGAVESADNDWMAFGRDVEGAVAKGYGRRTGRPVFERDPYELVRHPTLRWLAATPDRMTAGTLELPGPAPGPGTLEAKAVAGMKAAAWEEAPPVEYQIQAQIQMSCTGAAWGSLVALIGGIQIVWKDLARNDRFLDAALPRLEEFHLRVQRRDPPEETDALPETSRALRALFPGNGETVALQPDVLDLVGQWEAAKDRRNASDREADDVENHLRRLLGGATFGALADGSYLRLRETRRSGYTVEPTTYTTLGRYWPKVRRR